MEVRSKLSLAQQTSISSALDHLGVEVGEGPVGLKVQLAYGMFDTRGR